MRRGLRPSCEGSTLPLPLTVCTVKDALMLLLKGANNLETPKHDRVGKVLPDTVALRLPGGKGPFIPTPQGRGFLAPGR